MKSFVFEYTGSQQIGNDSKKSNKQLRRNDFGDKVKDEEITLNHGNGTRTKNLRVFLGVLSLDRI